MKTIWVILRVFGVGLFLAPFLVTVRATAAEPAAHFFAETGHTVRGVFWSYWQAHGGLAQQGYPLTEAIQERSELDGRVYTVQYFERAVFEWHPENQPPYDILLAQLGTHAYEPYLTHPPDQWTDSVNPRYFPETGHTVGGRFREYWEANGGLMQQGYPVSDVFAERNPIDGKLYAVQYFQRAVFEYHPENAAPYDVLLAPLGTRLYQETYWTVCSECAVPLTVPAADDASCDVSGSVNGYATPSSVHGGETVIATATGFNQTEPVVIILTMPDGTVVAQQSDVIRLPGEPLGLPIKTQATWVPGRWTITFEGGSSHHKAVINFCVQPPGGRGI